MVTVFPVLGESATAVEPGDGTLHDPALGFHNEAFRAIAAFDDFDQQAAHRFGGAVLEGRSSIGAVGEQLAQERELSEQGGQQQDAAVAILDIGGGDQRVQHQTECINQDVALLALDQFARIEAMPIDARAPFSALFTL
jgi:hypothetical protein